MKKVSMILKMVAIFALLSGCREYEMVEYGEGGEINFRGREKSGSRYYWTDDVAYLSWENNFGINAKGDSLMVDTVVLGVKIMGDVVDYNRKIVLTTVDPEENALDVEFPDTYYVPADTNAATLKVVVKRPPERGKIYKTELTFDYAASDFTAGTLERQYFKLQSMDSVSIALWGMSDVEWEMVGPELEYFFGPMSNTKIRYMVTLLGVVDLKSWYENLEFYDVLLADTLYNSLEKYKSNPDNPPLLDENTGEWIYFPSVNELM